MRVIAGTARGVPLVAPRDRGTRPIADRVKETLFAIVGERVVGASAVDLYSGSGAIGIEALSRGAAHVTFVERGRVALDAIRQNLERTRLAADASVQAREVLPFLAGPVGEPFDLAFLDPPYAERAILAPLERLVPHLAPDALVVVKHFWRTQVPTVEGLAHVRERRFGETALTFLEASSETDEVEVP
ncbi:MAG TPA: 16S rRNA (guanine(966)-N(2))-methyltransferase RsmD [Candidatus Limnocylindria bacterium]|jgi:16S rRNA (guanine966-N2)-methyltransferase